MAAESLKRQKHRQVNQIYGRNLASIFEPNNYSNCKKLY